MNAHIYKNILNLNIKIVDWENGSICLKNVYGDRFWYLNGKLHRTDGPAMDCASGNRWWYIDGKRHRTDGPAIKYADGSKHWYLNGKRYRTDGPAIKYADGDKSWWLNNKQYTKKEFDTIQLKEK